ncbi:PPA1309 family protein [Brachybacterium huguangmaarense]
MTDHAAPAGPGPSEDLDAPTAGLAAAVLEVARHVGDEPLPAPRWFALAPTAALIAAQPAFASLLDPAEVESARENPSHLTPIEIDAEAPTRTLGTTGGAHDPLAVLEHVAWPDIAAGAALVCDLAAVAPAAGSEHRAADRLGDGPVRAVVASRTDGTTWSALRGRGRRDWALGPRLVPDLADALAASIGQDADGS